MRLLVARCEVTYTGRLTAYLPESTRLLMIKADGSVLVHADAGGYRPLNWMTPPTVIEEGDGVLVVRKRAGRTEDRLEIRLHEVLSDVEQKRALYFAAGAIDTGFIARHRGALTIPLSAAPLAVVAAASLALLYEEPRADPDTAAGAPDSHRTSFLKAREPWAPDVRARSTRPKDCRLENTVGLCFVEVEGGF